MKKAWLWRPVYSTMLSGTRALFVFCNNKHIYLHMVSGIYFSYSNIGFHKGKKGSQVQKILKSVEVFKRIHEDKLGWWYVSLSLELWLLTVRTKCPCHCTQVWGCLSHLRPASPHCAHFVCVFAMSSPPPPPEFNGDSFILHAVLYRERFQQPLMQAKPGLDFHWFFQCS